MSYASAPQKSPVEADTKLIWLQQMGEDVAARRRLCCSQLVLITVLNYSFWLNKLMRVCFYWFHFAFVFPQLGADNSSPPRRQEPRSTKVLGSSSRLQLLLMFGGRGTVSPDPPVTSDSPRPRTLT